MEDLTAVIEDIPATGTIPPDLLEELGRQLNRLRRCLGLRVRVCRPGGGGGGQFTCNCVPGQTLQVLDAAVDLIDALTPPLGNIAQELADLKTVVNRNSDCIDPLLVAAINALTIPASPTPGQVQEVISLLIDLVLCVALGIDIGPRTSLSELRAAIVNYMGRPNTPDTPVTPIATTRQRLLDLLADQVVITTPTGLYAGTLVAVQADYIAVVAPTGTYLIPIDQIQTFTTE
ncbi:DUF2642 domain-containing protein [Priestia megaterium]|uniref:DUF2642 domain-containing protein n=1 Tax=Priestia megaterium TaxID=1404 RepID=UPI002A6B7D33|nr:DUF2642 domain-containing protein [Priestia megaterium]MDY0943749.1 DUF2642 domain-containing protein [Priestia megaterium]